MSEQSVRKVVLDTETTGLSHQQGHRIIEVGAMVIEGRRIVNTQRFHCLINPQREIDAQASSIHGITNELLQDKPVFSEIAEELMEFISGSQLVIHNASFDVGFLNAEFGRLGMPLLDLQQTIDTLMMARSKWPGRPASLDALCQVFGVDNTRRVLHGAMLDVELLAEVYLAMTRGQEALIFDEVRGDSAIENISSSMPANLKVFKATSEELVEHQKNLSSIKKDHHKCLWKSETK